MTAFGLRNNNGVEKELLISDSNASFLQKTKKLVVKNDIQIPYLIGGCYLFVYILSTINISYTLFTFSRNDPYFLQEVEGISETDLPVYYTVLAVDLSEILLTACLILGIYLNIRYLLCPWLILNGLIVITSATSLVFTIIYQEFDLVSLRQDFLSLVLVILSETLVANYFTKMGRKSLIIISPSNSV